MTRLSSSTFTLHNFRTQYRQLSWFIHKNCSPPMHHNNGMIRSLSSSNISAPVHRYPNQKIMNRTLKNLIIKRTFLTSPSICSAINSSSSIEDSITVTDETGISVVPENGNFSFIEYMQTNSSFSPSSGTIFSDTGPVIYVADLLCALKDFDGFSWVQIILCSTILIRLAIGLPIAIVQQQSVARLENLKPEIQSLVQELRKETSQAVKLFGWDEKTANRQFKKSFKKHWRKLVEDNNCHPMRTLGLALIQIPVWICFSSALRNIVFGLPLPLTEATALRWYQMHQEGLPWISSLTINDPYVLPAIFLVVNLTNIWLHNQNKPSGMPQTILQKSLPWIFTGGIVCISGFACYVPSAVSMYWATSSCVALTQNIILLHPKLRERLKMPIYSKKPPAQPPSSQSQPQQPA